MLFTKYFYGFEKEGSSVYFRENKNIQGFFFNYRRPIKQSLI